MHLGGGLVGECAGAEELKHKDRATHMSCDVERFGVSLKSIANGHRTDSCEIYTASFLVDPLLVAQLREAAMR